MCLGLSGSNLGSLEETIPEGFTYLPGDTVVTGGIGSGVIAGRVITFTLLGGDTLNYKLSIDSGAAAGRVHFSGILKAVDGSSQDILGDDEVTIVVAAQDTPTPAPTAEPEPTPEKWTRPAAAPESMESL